MHGRFKLKRILLSLLAWSFFHGSFAANDIIQNSCVSPVNPVFTSNAVLKNLADQLGWVQTGDNRCGGYYVEPPIIYPEHLVGSRAFQITSDQPFVFSRKGTSVFQGKVTITRYGQQISASKGYLYRNAEGHISAVDLVGDVHLREPGSLIIAKEGSFDKDAHAESLKGILYRTTVTHNFSVTQTLPSNEALQNPRIICQLSAWGQADCFSQRDPKIYELVNATYTTCPPLSNTWQVRAGHIILNKLTGRGTARAARLYIKGIPVIYIPYLNFPIDARRQSGILVPTVGSVNGHKFVGLPIYWNMAPNYDMTFTPIYIKGRGFQWNDYFRYLTPYSQGQLHFAVLPNDLAFEHFQNIAPAKYANEVATSNDAQTDLRRLLDASPTRKSISYQDQTRFNDHWASAIDYNWVSDDYYLQDFKTNVNEITTNQLLQQAELAYQDCYTNFLARFQNYQTLHPLGQIPYHNQYSRFPELLLNTDYPLDNCGLDFFTQHEFSHFDIRNIPDIPGKLPMGNRFHVQPGVSYRWSWPAFYVIPRLQMAMTKYDVGHIEDENSKTPSRALPIFDLHSGFYFDRKLSVCGCPFRQTLEPQMFYTFVPYRDQSQIPIFDTTLNTLTYDQLFVYNRFSGLDRIGDANQVSLGIATRFINDVTGYEKIKAGIGQIYYFRDRRVTLCYGRECPDQPLDAENKRNRSPISIMAMYFLNPAFSVRSDTIWNPFTSKIDNQNITFHYQPDDRRVINFIYTYVRHVDIFGIPATSGSVLKATDLSIGWPLTRDWSTVFRWSQDWQENHFQNLLYGLQYDSCCWAVRAIGGRTYNGITSNKTYTYTPTFFLQFALKGLGNIGPGSDPSQLLNNTIVGYHNDFGRDF